MLPLAHHTKAENKHNTASHWLKTLFFIFVVSLAVIAALAVCEKGEPQSMTSEVINQGVVWTVQMLKSSVSQAVHQDARGFIRREKTFNAKLLQSNVQRRAHASEERKEAKR